MAWIHSAIHQLPEPRLHQQIPSAPDTARRWQCW